MSHSKFHHEEIYRGKDLIAKLAKSKIVVCGAGALGSNLVDSITRQGFSSVKVIDFDRVETHNLGTQVYGEGDIGALKATALKNRVFRNVGVEIDAVSKKLDADNVKSLLKGADIVVDAFDNSASRKLIQDECRARKLVGLHMGLFADYGEIIWDQRYTVPKDVEGDVCDYPLARNLIMIVVSIAAEELLDYCLQKTPRLHNWTVTLKDLKVLKL